MSKEIDYFREITPYTDFLCALNFMKYDLTQIYKNTAGVDHVELYNTLKEWPSRIQQLRRDYDEYDEAKPGRMYPNIKDDAEDKKKKKGSCSLQQV